MRCAFATSDSPIVSAFSAGSIVKPAYSIARYIFSLNDDAVAVFQSDLVKLLHDSPSDGSSIAMPSVAIQLTPHCLYALSDLRFVFDVKPGW